MAVVSVTATDTGNREIQWSVPQEPELNFTHVPRGVRLYESQVAIALKIATNETRVEISFSFPRNFVYLLKTFTVRFISDDQTEQFDSGGAILYALDTFSNNPQVPLISDGNFFSTATLNKGRIWTTRDTPKYFIDGPAGDQFVYQLSDTHADESPAGDIIHNAEFYIYDIEQVQKWGVNTSLPVFNWGQ